MGWRATFLLTGGRRNEVLSFDVADLNFHRNQIHFRPNQWRRGKGKTEGAERTVPMWPQLEAILQQYLMGHRLDLLLTIGAEKDAPLFPSVRTGRPFVVIDAMYDRIAKRAGLQSLDNGQPVALTTVKGELGHVAFKMIEKVYGKLGRFRYRGEGVECRIATPFGTNSLAPFAERVDADTIGTSEIVTTATVAESTPARVTT